jgi:TRAP-type uncharacterized transport system substrate-binding protein
MMVIDYFRSHRNLLMIAIIAAAVLVIALLWMAVSILRPLPPRAVTMVTGPEGSAYHAFGMRYREILAREGIELRLLPTAGAVENLALLQDPRSNVKIGFLQGGIANGKESPDLLSLGAVFYEPLWFFYRDLFRGKGIQDLRGRKISIGPEGGGTRALTLKLLERNGIDQRFAELMPLTPQAAGEKLVRGEIDAAFLITSWDDPVVQRLLREERIELASFPRADAYITLYPYLNKVVLPTGVVDLRRNRPPTDVFLFAPKASIAVRNDLHPAIQYLLLVAAEKVHSGPEVFQRAGAFPSAESIDLPLGDEARQFYRSGRPFLQRHLPFWMAVLFDRLLVLLIPVVGVVYPLVRFMPAVYNWEMQRRIYRLYGALRSLEQELAVRDGERDVDALRTRLDRLEEKADRLRVTVFYANMLYTLKEHIDLVRTRLSRSSVTGK